MDDGRIKQATTILQYKEQFLKALNPDDNPDFPPKLGDLAARLKAWRNTLQQAVDEAIDPVLKLEDETRGLMVCVCFCCIYSPLFNIGNKCISSQRGK